MNIKAYFNNFFWLFLTYLAAPYLYARIVFKKKGNGQRILVIQTAKIGDLVCTTPVFREIKNNFPDAYLTAIVIDRSQDILKNNPHIDQVISITGYRGIIGGFRLIKKIRKENYDWSLVMLPDYFNNIIGFWSLAPNRATTTHEDTGEITKLTSIFNNFRREYKKHTSALRHYLGLLNFLGIKEYSEEKELFILPEEERVAEDFLNKNNLKKEDLLVGMSVTSEVAFRQWDLKKFAALADMLVEKLGAKIIFIGAQSDFAKNEQVREMMKNNSINSAGCFKLRDFPAFMKNLKLFISMDTGPIYIANALGVPVVDIVGADDMNEQSPSGPKCAIIQKELYCSPCIFVFSGIRYCKEGHLRCLKEISPEDVFEAAKKLL